MKFTLEQDVIESALRTYLQANYGLSLRNKEAVMNFTAGRGKNGLTVQVLIKDATIPGEDAASIVIGTTTVGQNMPKVSAAEKITTAIASAQPGTVGAALGVALNAVSTVAVEVKAEEVKAELVVADKADYIATDVAEAVVSAADAAGQEAPVAEEVEVVAVTTETAVAAEAAPVEAEVKPAPPKTTSGLFA